MVWTPFIKAGLATYRMGRVGAKVAAKAVKTEIKLLKGAGHASKMERHAARVLARKGTVRLAKEAFVDLPGIFTTVEIVRQIQAETAAGSTVGRAVARGAGELVIDALTFGFASDATREQLLDTVGLEAP